MPPAEPLVRIRPSLRSFAGLYVVLGLVCVGIWWLGATFDTGVRPLVIAVAGPVPLLLGIAYSWLVRLGAEYRLYADSLEIETGLVSRNIDNLQLFRVRDLGLRQSLIGRLLGVGGVNVTSTDQSTPHLTIRGVAGPRALYDTLRERVAESQATRRPPRSARATAAPRLPRDRGGRGWTRGRGLSHRHQAHGRQRGLLRGRGRLRRGAVEPLRDDARRADSTLGRSRLRRGRRIGDCGADRGAMAGGVRDRRGRGRLLRVPHVDLGLGDPRVLPVLPGVGRGGRRSARGPDPAPAGRERAADATRAACRAGRRRRDRRDRGGCVRLRGESGIERTFLPGGAGAS